MYRYWRSLYRFRFPVVITYMLQSTDYSISAYLDWVRRTKNFDTVIKRQELRLTTYSRSIMVSLYAAIYLQSFLGLITVLMGVFNDRWEVILLGFLASIAAPVVWMYIICLPITVMRLLFINRKQKAYIRSASKVFHDFKGYKIAVAGSYGKTTVKELLVTVLSEGLKVKGTPANKNVLISHARFAQSLQGDEDVLVIEYGEGKPGDVALFREYTQPTHVIISGIAPAHLDAYKTLEAAAEDIFSSTVSLTPKNVYVNAESTETEKYHKEFITYDRYHVGSWKISLISMDMGGMKLRMKKGSRVLELSTQLLGMHLLGPLAMAVDIADTLGLSDEQITKGIANTRPYEHRMQPYRLNGGWVIDDSYNGNIDGIKAGTELLKSLSAKRKIYVTPGLVEQGDETESVHIRMGAYIADADPDTVVLMNNTVTPFIREGLSKGGYKGDVRIEDDPLYFYENLDSYIAAGDIILLQNDWTDNYA